MMTLGIQICVDVVILRASAAALVKTPLARRDLVTSWISRARIISLLVRIPPIVLVLLARIRNFLRHRLLRGVIRVRSLLIVIRRDRLRGMRRVLGHRRIGILLGSVL